MNGDGTAVDQRVDEHPSRDGRTRRLYRATDAGRAALAEGRAALAELARAVLGPQLPE